MHETIQEMRRLASLTGSIGRLITRFILRHFKAELGGYEIELRACAKRVSSQLEFAVFVAYLQAEANDHQEWIEHPAVRMSVFAWSSSDEVSLIVRVNELPEAVKERQAVLLAVAEVMERHVQHYDWISEGGMLDHQVRSFLGELFYRREDDSFRIFGDLVKGIYVDLEKCDRRLVCLAALMNSHIASVVPAGFNLKLEGLGVDEVHELMEAHSGEMLEVA